MIKVKLSARKFTPYACTLFGVRRREPSHVFTDPPVCSPLPTHNREPYNTLLSDTIASDPSVEPMPLSSTRFM